MIEEESQQTIECKAAIRAALEKVGEYCGLKGIGAVELPEHGRYIKFAGEIIEYPDSIQDIMDSHAPPERQIELIAATPWAEETAREQCKGMYGVELPAFDECIKWMSTDLARAVVFQRFEQVEKIAA
jgi:hypothetical protein